MKPEQQIRNTLKTLIEGLKDSFDDEDMEYLKINKILLCQEEHLWGRYTLEVEKLMSKINLLVDILEIKENEFEKYFDSIERR